MQFVCIGVEGSTGTLMQHLNSELVQLKKDKVDYSLEQIDKGGSISIICSINDDNYYNEKSVRSYRALKIRIANALADYIIRQYEEKLILRTINNNYCYFNAAEKRDILNNVLKMIEDEEKNGKNNSFKVRRRNIIIKSLLDYFESTNSLILDGFVNFRLKDYIKDLEEIVDRAVDDYLMDREYKEFIRLLRYFVDVQEPKADVIHVIAGYNRSYMLLDQSRKEITNECMQEFANEMADGEINHDDLLVSSLITYAPKKIIIHCDGHIKNKEMLETIKNVFLDKVAICHGCDLCLINAVKTEK